MATYSFAKNWGEVDRIDLGILKDTKAMYSMLAGMVTEYHYERGVVMEYTIPGAPNDAPLIVLTSKEIDDYGR
jgi:hypothetical protein